VRSLHLLGCLASVACSSPFDDLERKAWSDSRSRPVEISSMDYPAAITTTDTERLGATIVLAGAGPASLVTLTYDERGGRAERGVELGANFDGPLGLAGAVDLVAGADGAFVVAGLGPSLEIYDARSGAEGPSRRNQIDAALCGGAAYPDLGRKLVFGLTNAGDPNAPDLIALAGGDLLVFSDLAVDAPNSCARCALTSASGGVATGIDVAVADLGGLEGEEILVSIADPGGGPGSLMAIDAAKVIQASDNPCTSAIPEFLFAAPSGDPDFGASLAVGGADDNDLLEIAASAPRSQRVYVLHDVDATSPTGAPLAAIAVPDAPIDRGIPMVFADLDGDEIEELAIAESLASPSMAVGAGQVTIYSLPPGAVEFARVATIFDSSPEPAQAFGRTLAVAEFIGGAAPTDLLVVGAQAEVFVYFRSVLGGTDPRMRSP